MKVNNLSPEQIITISQKESVGDFEQAMEIVRVFRDKKRVYIPQGDFFLGFWQMIAAVWCGGYIAGVQAERRNHREG